MADPRQEDGALLLASLIHECKKLLLLEDEECHECDTQHLLMSQMCDTYVQLTTERMGSIIWERDADSPWPCTDEELRHHIDKTMEKEAKLREEARQEWVDYCKSDPIC